MGVYIKGVNLPKCCGYCPFEYKNYCMAKPSLRVEYADRHPICPLVPVPPHGDLIDRDELERDIERYVGGEESRSRFHHWVQVQNAVILGDKGEET